MELNDRVCVTLAACGAQILNEKNHRLQKISPHLPWKTDYKEGDDYSDQLWSLLADFQGQYCCGERPPFYNIRGCEDEF